MSYKKTNQKNREMYRVLNEKRIKQTAEKSPKMPAATCRTLNEKRIEPK